MTNVINISTVRSGNSGTGFETSTKELSFEVTSDRNIGQAQKRLALEDIYPDPAAFEPELLSARSLLKEYVRLLDDASEELDAQDTIASDEAASRAHLLVPELFCCRSLGDGFGAVVLALFHCVRNLRGMPLSAAHIELLKDTALQLFDEPYISFERSIVCVERMQETGLSPDPERLGYLNEALDVDADDG